MQHKLGKTDEENIADVIEIVIIVDRKVDKEIIKKHDQDDPKINTENEVIMIERFNDLIRGTYIDGGDDLSYALYFNVKGPRRKWRNRKTEDVVLVVELVRGKGYLVATLPKGVCAVVVQGIIKGDVIEMRILQIDYEFTVAGLIENGEPEPYGRIRNPNIGDRLCGGAETFYGSDLVEAHFAGNILEYAYTLALEQRKLLTFHNNRIVCAHGQ